MRTNIQEGQAFLHQIPRGIEADTARYPGNENRISLI